MGYYYEGTTYKHEIAIRKMLCVVDQLIGSNVVSIYPNLASDILHIKNHITG